ncbi:MAG: MFS transporter [Planctomycetes bacterium]|nr:MFS transporter [Planctomycetota bacterium]
MAGRALILVLGYRLYARTGDPGALGFLGLVEAIPALPLSLFGGHVADRHDRRRILLITLPLLIACAALLSASEFTGYEQAELPLIFAVAFVAGVARGFAEPAASALEAQVVPFNWLVNSSTLMASCWTTAAVIGPLVGPWMYATWGGGVTYASIAALYAIAFLAITGIAPKPIPVAPEGESVWQSVALGVRYVWRDQVLLGSMALDLFAVLFGGAIALLPVFAKDVLQVGEGRLGEMGAAPTLGALLTTLWCARHPPVKHAGRNIFLAVGAFGVTMIVFALSKSFYLSLVALFFSGVFDGVSVVIRRSIMRLLSPEPMRGRIAAVSMVFIGASNELGAFESGMAAKWLGTERAVWMGGVITLLIVSSAALAAPQLRRLSLDPQRAKQREMEEAAKLDEEAAGNA